MSPSPRTIVFDLDGTLVDTAPDLIGALNHALALQDCAPLPLAQARDMIGAGARALIERGLAAQGVVVSPERFQRLHRAFLDHYRANIAVDSRPFPNVETALDALAAGGHRLAVCTNKPEAFARLLLSALGMDRRFGAIVGGDTTAAPKPDPRPLATAIHGAGGAPGRAVMVGDSKTDLDTARALGVPAVLVDFGYTSIPARALGADAVISDFAALPAVVAALP